MIEMRFPNTGLKIEESPEHDRAYIALFKNRFTSLLKARNLGDATEYLPAENNEEEISNTQLTKNEFLTNLRESAKENIAITTIIENIEISLEKVK